MCVCVCVCVNQFDLNLCKESAIFKIVILFSTDTAFKCETLCRAFIGAIFGCVAILGVVIGLAILCVCIEKKKEGNKEELEERSV